jgi:lipoprotein-anchoring transpeptidase ErfK/SrfK
MERRLRRVNMKLLVKVLSISTAGAIALSALPSGATAAQRGAAKVPYRPSATQKVATLNADKTTYKSPGGRHAGSVSKNRPITGEATTLPVLKTVTRGKTTWLDVRLPGRPNSHTGWITSTHTYSWKTSWHLVVAVGPNTTGFSNSRRVYAFNHGKLVKDWLVVTGAPGRVTPTGQFFVEENISYRRDPSFPGSPYALATSARSDTFTEFDGGPGQVALHGMGGGLYARPGTAVSHGCVRLLNRDITWLANRILPGTPVTIVRG